jgi:hypothetical protein
MQPAVQGKSSKHAVAREWTAVEKFRLKDLAKQAHSAEKIAKMLKRPVGATVAMASKLGYQLTRLSDGAWHAVRL